MHIIRFCVHLPHCSLSWSVAQGGLIMMRPCQKTYEVMTQIIAEHPQYQFVESYAEQDFLKWYFRYTAVELPTRYNLNFCWLDWEGLGRAGQSPSSPTLQTLPARSACSTRHKRTRCGPTSATSRNSLSFRRAGATCPVRAP